MLNKKTLVITGLLISLFGLFFNFYSHYKSQQIAEINYLNNKLENKKRELKTPLIDVNINTLDMSALPDEIINYLTVIPSTIEIENIRGETAKNITLDIISSVSINTFKKWKTIEHFTASCSNGNNKRLIIHIPQIRKDSKIGITLLTSKIPKVDFKFIAEKGELFDLDKEASERKKIEKLLDEEIGKPTFIPFGRRNHELEIISAKHTNLEYEIKWIEKKLDELRTDNIGKAILRFFLKNPILLIILLFASGVVLLSLTQIKSFKTHNELLQTIRKSKIKIGDSIFVVIESLGSPSCISVPEDRENFDLSLNYPYFKYTLFWKDLFIKFRFKDFKLIQVIDEKNNKVIVKGPGQD